MSTDASEYSTRWRLSHPGKGAAYAAKWRLHHPEWRERRVANIQRNTAMLSEIKRQPCADCGQTFPPECMDFDHVLEEKTQDLSRMLTYSVSRLLEEVAKCDVVCANCHRIRTWSWREDPVPESFLARLLKAEGW